MVKAREGPAVWDKPWFVRRLWLLNYLREFEHVGATIFWINTFSCHGFWWPVVVIVPKQFTKSTHTQKWPFWTPHPSSHSFRLLEEFESMYGVNAELFDTADEMFGAQNFSSRYG